MMGNRSVRSRSGVRGLGETRVGGRGLGGVSLREIAVQDREIRIGKDRSARAGNQQRADDGIGRIGMDDGGRRRYTRPAR
jgi:hypothetical protein